MKFQKTSALGGFILTFEFIWSIVTFSFGMSATPGPNNTVAFSTGFNYGFVRILPYALGVSVGVPVMIAAVALGLGEFLHAFPQFYRGIRYAGAAYILYLAWKIATAAPPENREDSETDAPKRDRCPTFLNGVLFQWMNPKAWILAGTGTIYLGREILPAKLIFMCGMFAAACLISLSAWGLGGAISGRLTRSPRVYRLLNAAMGLLLASSAATLF